MYTINSLKLPNTVVWARYEHYIDTSYGMRVLSTNVTWMLENGRVKSEHFYNFGKMSEEQVVSWLYLNTQKKRFLWWTWYE